MDIPLWISILSLLIAFLAALYSRWVWSEAKRTNLLALHANRMDVFRGFNALRQAVLQQGTSIEKKHVAPFYHHSREARFYFSKPETAELLREYYDVCFYLADASIKLDRHSISDAERVERQAKQDKLVDDEQKIFLMAEKAIENELLQPVRRKWLSA